jgi:hypothetical protein
LEEKTSNKLFREVEKDTYAINTTDPIPIRTITLEGLYLSQYNTECPGVVWTKIINLHKPEKKIGIEKPVNYPQQPR